MKVEAIGGETLQALYVIDEMNYFHGAAEANREEYRRNLLILNLLAKRKARWAPCVFVVLRFTEHLILNVESLSHG